MTRSTTGNNRSLGGRHGNKCARSRRPIQVMKLTSIVDIFCGYSQKDLVLYLVYVNDKEIGLLYTFVNNEMCYGTWHQPRPKTAKR
jgi:hypothetical protein